MCTLDITMPGAGQGAFRFDSCVSSSPEHEHSQWHCNLSLQQILVSGKMEVTQTMLLIIRHQLFVIFIAGKGSSRTSASQNVQVASEMLRAAKACDSEA